MNVYMPSTERVANYHAACTTIPDLRLVPAADGIHDYERHRENALLRKLVTPEYIRANERLPGKLGCNLSHLGILQEIAVSEESWGLVLEDDVVLNGYAEADMETVAREADRLRAHYVQLYTNPRFVELQRAMPLLSKGLYTMIPQWHTCAYLITREGARRVLNETPLDDNIDHVFGRLVSSLHSVTYLNSVFLNKGTLDSYDRSSQFGSTIMENAVKGVV